MSSNYINGYQYPKFLIYNASTNAYIETILLEYTDSAGMTESDIFFKQQYTNIFYEKDDSFEAIHKEFTLSYSGYSSKDNSLDLQKIINYSITKISGVKPFKVLLYPRADGENYYEVLFTGNRIDKNIKKGRQNAAGNKSIVAVFETKYPLTALDWKNPEMRYSFDEDISINLT
jgi:hypothetical protein